MDPPDTLKALDSIKGLKLVHWNVRSLPKKIDQIRVMLAETSLDIVTLSETWLKPDLKANTTELAGSKAFRLHREVKNKRSKTSKKGGGLITYIHYKHSSKVELLNDMNVSNKHIEALWIHMPFCKNIYVCNMYRPPKGDLEKVISYLDS